MLKPLQPLTRARTAQSLAVPSPVGGWNARNSLDAMDQTDAVLLENWFPAEGYCITRKGYAAQCVTGETTYIGALHTLITASSQKMVAGVNGKLINASSASPSTIGSGYANNYWKAKNFQSRLFLVNGVDTPLDWDGTTLTATAWNGSGLTITDLSDLCVYKSRLYFVQKNSRSFWYGATNAVTGTLTQFNLSGLGNFGGKLVGIETITSDGGDGVNDLIAFFMSSGDVIVYVGSDPSDATAWSLVGVFHLGALVAAGAVCKAGSDIFAATTDGFIPLTRVFSFGRNLSTRQTLSDKISQATNYAATQYGGNAGWQVILYPRGKMILFNVPRTATQADQYVMNMTTGAWCKFRNQNGLAWTIYNDNLYFGGINGTVYQADTGTSDAGTAITATAQTAWNYFNDRASLKRFTLMRPIFQAPNDPGISKSLGVDFDAQVLTASSTSIPASSDAIWDVSVWDTAVWGGSQRTAKSWQSLTGLGYAASLKIALASTGQQTQWLSTNYVFERGGIL